VVAVRAVRGLARGARAQAAARSTVISLFMWIPQLMSCGIHMIMARAALPSGQTRTERARADRRVLRQIGGS